MTCLPPDHAEERCADSLDDPVATRDHAVLPLVGLGGSAGSIPALTTFFRLLPPDSGMAFVVVLHLAPAQESLLAELLQRVTTMRVTQARHGERVEANRVYVIPPGRALRTLDGELRLGDLERAPGRHVAIDRFFQSLADSHGPQATVVVLSGADGDGSVGIRRIKERGGRVIAQDPCEAEHGDMPRAAIATGLVDWVLPVAQIAARLLALHSIGSRPRQPPEAAPHELVGARERALHVHAQLMERFAPPSVVVDSQHRVLHLSALAHRFLRLGGGEPSRDLLRLVPAALRPGLRAALRHAAQSKGPSEVLHLPVHIDGESILVDISVAPADELAPRCLLVVFDAAPAGVSGADRDGTAASAAARGRELDAELGRLRSHLCDMRERHAASTEELRTSQAELLAMNMDLCSATAELEARRQEAQSMHEELGTVGAQLRRAALEAGERHRELQDVMSAMSMAMIFLDRGLRISFYTPGAVGLFRLIPTDIGRPLADLAQHFEYPQLLDDAARVLGGLAPIEREVGDADGCFLARVQPCGVDEEHIAGVVLTFTDVTDERRLRILERAAVRRLEKRCTQLQEMLSVLPDAVCVFDARRRLTYANAAARRFWGLGEDGEPRRTLPELGRRASLAVALDRELQRALAALASGAASARSGVECRSGTQRGFRYGIATLASDPSEPPALLLSLREKGAQTAHPQRRTDALRPARKAPSIRPTRPR